MLRERKFICRQVSAACFRQFTLYVVIRSISTSISTYTQCYTFTMSSKPITAYKQWEALKPQDQTGGPGLDKAMDPSADWSQLEFWTDDGKPFLKEYEGRGLLKDKAVIVTGGDSGIGRAVAILMAREGADVSLVYLPEEEEDAKYTATQIEKAGRKANRLPLNLREEADCKKAVDEHLKAFGKINVLVNNASMQEICDDIVDINLSVVEKTFRTNILSMIALTKYSIQHMTRGDCVVSSTSVAGYAGNPNMVDYSSTKGAIVSFTRTLAQQQAAKGIRINAVAPGIIWTPLQPATKNNPPEAMENLGVGMTPLPRPGMPVECATAYVFLASPLGSFTTGEVIHVNGGLEAQG